MGGGFLFLDTRLLHNLTKKQSLISNINMQQDLQKFVKFVLESLCFKKYFRKSLKQDNVLQTQLIPLQRYGRIQRTSKQGHIEKLCLKPDFCGLNNNFSVSYVNPLTLLHHLIMKALKYKPSA